MSAESTSELKDIDVRPNLEASVSKSPDDEPSLELSKRRTGLSFQRTRMSADRTLMSVLRTSLSLISFGFTIFQFFRSLRESGSASEATVNGARNFGMTLILVGIGMLIIGLGYQFNFMKALRHERKALVGEGLLHGELPYPVSLTSIVAFVLLAVGAVTLIGMYLRQGPFQ